MLPEFAPEPARCAARGWIRAIEEMRWIPEREIVVWVIALMGMTSPPMKKRMFPDLRKIVVFPFSAKIRKED